MPVAEMLRSKKLGVYNLIEMLFALGACISISFLLVPPFSGFEMYSFSGFEMYRQNC